MTTNSYCLELLQDKRPGEHSWKRFPSEHVKHQLSFDTRQRKPMVTEAPHDTIPPAPPSHSAFGYLYSILLEVLAHNLKWNVHLNLKMWKTKQITLTHKGGVNSRIPGTFIQGRYCGQWSLPQESSRYFKEANFYLLVSPNYPSCLPFPVAVYWAWKHPAHRFHLIGWSAAGSGACWAKPAAHQRNFCSGQLTGLIHFITEEIYSFMFSI